MLPTAHPSQPTRHPTLSEISKEIAALVAAAASGRSSALTSKYPSIQLKGPATDVVYIARRGAKFKDYYIDPGVACTHHAFGLKSEIPDVPETIRRVRPGVHKIRYMCTSPDNPTMKATPVFRTVITKVGVAPTAVPTAPPASPPTTPGHHSDDDDYKYHV
jgi:hypothetical protein